MKIKLKLSEIRMICEALEHREEDIGDRRRALPIFHSKDPIVIAAASVLGERCATEAQLLRALRWKLQDQANA